MKVNRSDSQVNVVLSGPIGESSSLFTLPLASAKELLIDMKDVTYINSIGVKHWILWTVKVPKECDVKLVNCPFVIASQASMVMGFMTPKMKIESVRVPYQCESCGTEQVHLASRGIDYEYALEGKPAQYRLPAQLPCPKCSVGKMEPDFIIEKTFKFLG